MNKRSILPGVLSKIHAGFVLAFLYLPIAVVVAFSFNESRRNIVFTGFTFEWYGKIFENARLLEAFGNTVIVALASTVISVLVGTLGAYGLVRNNFFGKKAIESLMYIPVVIPEIILGIALLAIFTMARLPLGLLTLIIAHATFCIPFVVFTVKARLSGFDRSVEEAAMDLGANRFRTFIEVTLPALMPGIVSGGLLSLTLSMDDVIISFFTTGPNSTTLPIQIFSMVRSGVSPDVNALSTLILVGTIGLVFFSQGRDLFKKTQKA